MASPGHAAAFDDPEFVVAEIRRLLYRVGTGKPETRFGTPDSTTGAGDAQARLTRASGRRGSAAVRDSPGRPDRRRSGHAVGDADVAVDSAAASGSVTETLVPPPSRSSTSTDPPEIMVS